MLTRFVTLQGYTLAAADGDIGKVREFYFDDQNWLVRYLVVDTGRWLMKRPVLIIPEVLTEADPQTNAIGVRLTKAAIRDAPSIDCDKPVSRQCENELHQYYQWRPYWAAPVASAWAAVSPSAIARAEERTAENVRATECRQAGADAHLRSSAELIARYSIQAIDGEIGRVYDFLIDDVEWQVRYLVVRCGSWLFGKDLLLAPEWIECISSSDGKVLINLHRAALEDAPPFDANAGISRSFEQRVHEHYHRRRYWSIPQAAGGIA